MNQHATAHPAVQLVILAALGMEWLVMEGPHVVDIQMNQAVMQQLTFQVVVVPML